MRWFRLYDDLLDDPKVQQLPAPLFKHWVNLMCLASKGDPRGTLPEVEDIAFRLRLTPSKAFDVIGELMAAGLVERGEEGRLMPHNWAGRQRVSDDVAERVRKSRNVSRNGSVTLHETPLKLSRATDTDTETEEETNAPPLPPNGNVIFSADAEEVVLAFCEITNAEFMAMPSATVRTQEEAAERLLTSYGRADVEGCMRWLQTWRRVPWTMATVRKEIDEWIAKGRPASGKTEAAPPARASPTLDPARYKNGGHLGVKGRPT